MEAALGARRGGAGTCGWDRPSSRRSRRRRRTRRAPRRSRARRRAGAPRRAGRAPRGRAWRSRLRAGVDPARRRGGSARARGAPARPRRGRSVSSTSTKRLRRLAVPETRSHTPRSGWARRPVHSITTARRRPVRATYTGPCASCRCQTPSRGRNPCATRRASAARWAASTASRCGSAISAVIRPRRRRTSIARASTTWKPKALPSSSGTQACATRSGTAPSRSPERFSSRTHPSASRTLKHVGGSSSSLTRRSRLRRSRLRHHSRPRRRSRLPPQLDRAAARPSGARSRRRSARG